MKHKHLFILWAGSEFRPLFALAHVAFVMFLSLFVSNTLAAATTCMKYVRIWCCMFKRGRRALNTCIFTTSIADERKRNNQHKKKHIRMN